MPALASRTIDDAALERAVGDAYRTLQQQYGLPMGKGAASNLLARFYGAYTVLKPVQADVLDGAGDAAERHAASEAYAFGLAALLALGDERLRKVPANGYRPDFGVAEPSPRDRERLILHPVLQEYLANLQRVGDGQKTRLAEQAVRAFYDAAQRRVASLPGPVRRAAERQPLTVRGQTYRGLEPYGGAPRPPALAAATGLDRVVGNRAFLTGAGEVLRMLLHFDPDTGRNCYLDAGERLPVGSLTYGPSGTGKTMVWQLLFQEVEEAAACHGLAPVERLSIDTSGRTEMQNSGLRALQEVFLKAEERGRIHLILGDEIDTVIYGPEQTRHNVDEAKIEGAFLTAMTRLEMLRAGNVHAAFITNHIERITERIRARMREATFEALGPQTGEEHARLLLQELGYFKELGLLHVEDAALIGETSRSYGFSGRDLKNIGVSLHAASCPPSYDPSRPMHEQDIDPTRDAASVREARRKDGRAIDDALLRETMASYAASVARMRAEEREKLIEQGVEGRLIDREIRCRLLAEFPEPDSF